MTSDIRPSGVIAAAATPLRPDFAIDRNRLVRHCGWLLDHGCDGINLLGTTGEATSFSVDQRLGAMQAVAESGLPLARIMVGTGAAAFADAVRLTDAAKSLGFAGALVLPPFYYKGVTDDGLIAFIDTLVDRVGATGLRLYLYHFPQNSGVPYPVHVVAALKKRHPDVLRGLKDSSGDLGYAASLASTIADFDVFPSAEGALAKARDLRFAGCISATANVTAPFAAEGWRREGAAEAAVGIAKAVALRQALSTVNLIAAIKWALADLLGEPGWMTLCPPLRPLEPHEIAGLAARLRDTDYHVLKAGTAPPRAKASAVPR